MSWKSCALQDSGRIWVIRPRSRCCGGGCQALQARHHGAGWLCAVIIWAEIGDVRRFCSSDQLARFTGLDVTVYSSADKCSPRHLSARPAAARPITPTTTECRAPRRRQGPDPSGGAQAAPPLLSHPA